MDRLDLDLAWAVGFFEGEGSFYLWTRRELREERNDYGNIYIYPRAQLNSVDQDIVEKFKEIVQVGTIRGPYKVKGKNNQPQWQWQLTQTEQVKRLAFKLYPYLGSRRRIKIDEVFRNKFGRVING